MISYVFATAFAAVFVGAAFAQRCRIFSLLPTFAMICGAAIMGALRFGAEPWTVALFLLVAVSGLQMGFLGSAALATAGIRANAGQPARLKKSGRPAIVN